MLILLLLIALLFTPPLGFFGAEAAQHFQTEQEAKKHCPNDTVVWVSTKTGVYHFKGQRWYGATKQGIYECKNEADQECDRATHNRQQRARRK